MFPVVEKAIGRVRVGQKTILQFPYQPGITIASMKTPCDCSTIFDIRKENYIKIVYEAKPVPPQLKHQGYYSVRKEFVITWQNQDGVQNETKLYFTATIYE